MADSQEPAALISRELSLEQDRKEGAEINALIQASPRQIVDDPVVVPDDLQRNILVTSVDALGELGPEERHVAGDLRPGLLRLRDDEQRHDPLRYCPGLAWRRFARRPGRRT